MSDLKINYCKIIRQRMQLKNYSPRTVSSYIDVIYNFLDWVDVPPTKVSNKHFQEFILCRSFKSLSSQNRYVSALKYFYYKILERRQKLPEFERPRVNRKLPVVVDKAVMLDKLSKIKNLKHKAILTLAYSTGMRVSEISNVMITDIDSDRMLVMIRNSKFNKDRYVKLSTTVLELLREYYTKYRPKGFLFNGEYGGQYSTSSLGKISHKYLGVSFHKIRHSNATAILEAGTNLRILQKHLGHSSSKTTEIYTHVSNDILQKVETPI